jgi:hypothetical protein
MAKFPSPPFGKDKLPHSSEGFISEALHGGKGASEGMFHSKGGRDGQTILTAVPPDNVCLAMDIESSILDKKFAGSETDLGHSLKGASAVQDGIHD